MWRQPLQGRSSWIRFTLLFVQNGSRVPPQWARGLGHPPNLALKCSSCRLCTAPLSRPLDGTADPYFNTSLGLGKRWVEKIDRWDAVECLKFVKADASPHPALCTRPIGHLNKRPVQISENVPLSHLITAAGSLEHRWFQDKALLVSLCFKFKQLFMQWRTIIRSPTGRLYESE